MVVKLQKNVLASKRSGDIEEKTKKEGYLQDRKA